MVKQITLNLTAFIYQNLLKKALFQIDSEIVHERTTSMGQILGKFALIRQLFKIFYHISDPILEQKILGLDFKNPIGLSAGFDYEAKLTQFLPSIGFGFTTVGTITNLPYPGNSKPMLGRLPKSKSLMVNKGFKNLGIKKTLGKLESLDFAAPIGLSIGKTNLPEVNTQTKAIEDIISSFSLAEESRVKFTHYELNISCPNLNGDIEFYSPDHLKELLKAIDGLKLKRPVFVKMPITKTDQEVLKMLEVLSKFSIGGVIFGNLQGDRKDLALDPEEVAKFPVGNFSGKPTFKRSNELIKLAYQNYGQKLLIVGCGGVFSAEDAYLKIKLGASLVELVTGLVYQGPQLTAQINLGLIKLLKQDGFKNIKEAIGIEARKV